MLAKIRVYKQGTHVNEKKQAVSANLLCKIKFVNGFSLPASTMRLLRKKFNSVIKLNVFHGAVTFNVTGVTKVRGADTFNQRRGSDIAEAKAENKAYSIAKNILDTVKDQMRVLSERADDDIQRMETKSGKASERFNQLSEE